MEGVAVNFGKSLARANRRAEEARRKARIARKIDSLFEEEWEGMSRRQTRIDPDMGLSRRDREDLFGVVEHALFDVD